MTKARNMRMVGVALAIVALIAAGCGRSTSEEVTPTDPGPNVGGKPEHDTADAPSARIDAETLGQHVFEQLVDFARTSDLGSLDDVRFTPTVALGLGSTIVVELPREQLQAAHRWQIDAEHHRAYAGPFSALDLLAQDVATDVVVGDHPHCASPPVAPPDGHADKIRVSVQPRAEVIDSCLQWWTVDAYVTPDGEIAAITLDLWEP